MAQQVKEYVVYKDNEAYKRMSLPDHLCKEYCANLNRAYPNSSWSIQRRFYPNETD